MGRDGREHPKTNYFKEHVFSSKREKKRKKESIHNKS